MEKKYHDYIRHFEKLDFDVISEEEIWEEREGLELRLTEIHYEMIRMLLPMLAFLICACIFLSAGFNGFFIGNFILAGVFAVLCIYFFTRYRTLADFAAKLSFYMDKLT